MPAQMTSTAWGQGARNALIVGTAMLVVWCIFTAAVVWVFKQPIFRTLGVSGAALCLLALSFFLASWLYGRGVRGGIVLDCGPYPTWWLFLVNAGLFALTGLMNAVDTILKWIDGPEATWETVLFGVGWPVIMMILFVPYWLIMAGGRLQLRENGIWQYWGLLRWSKIRWYRWANDATLLIRPNGIFSWFQGGGGALPVPPEHKQAIEELLVKHCPNARNA
jgi:hypothetical protein